MATLDEERYLRNLLLFGEGGMFVMRHIVEKEAGNTLVTLLLSNKHLFNNVLPEQRRILYPSPTTANVDLKSWDMSILLLVMKKLLSAGLPPAVVANIAALKAYRNSLAGHPTSMSMSYTEYNTNQALIQGTLRSLAVYVNRSREIEDIIIRTESGSIDIRSVIRQIKETQAFRFDILTRIQRILDDKLNPINQKLSSMETDLKCIKETADTSKKNQEEVNTSLLLGNEGLNLKVEKLSERFICWQRSNMQSKKHKYTKELKTIIRADCDDDEKREQATDLLFTFVESITDNNKYDSLEIKRMISQRVEWYGELTLQLMDDMMEWFTDIYKHCDGTGDVGYGSIHLPIYCSSMNSLLTLLDYIYGHKSKQSLERISSLISKLFGASFSLSWKTEPSNLQKVMSSFTKVDNIEPGSSKKNLKNLMLPFHTTDIKQVRNVWRMFGGEDKSVHLEKVSGTLSKIFGENIHLKTSVDKYQFIEVVNQTVEDKKRTINSSPGDCVKESSGAALKQPSDKVLEPRAIPQVDDKRTVIHRSPLTFFQRIIGTVFGQPSENVIGPDAIQKGLHLEKKGDLKLDEAESFSSIADQSSFDLFFLYQIDSQIEISRIVVIPDNKLLAIGRHDKNLYELDTSFKVVKAIELPNIPNDMCYIGEDRAAVCLFTSVVIVSTTEKNSVETLSGVSECVSVTFHDNLLYCLDKDGHIYIYDTMMDKVKTTYTVQNVLYGFPHLYMYVGYMSKGITVSNDGKMIYINNWRKLLTIDDKGHILSELPLENPLHSMSIMEDGTIMCSFIDERELVQIDQCGQKVLRKIQLPEEPWSAYSMCYDKSKSRLFLVDESKKIRVYELR